MEIPESTSPLNCTAKIISYSRVGEMKIEFNETILKNEDFKNNTYLNIIMHDALYLEFIPALERD